MVDFNLLEGTLYVGESPDPERFEDNDPPAHLHSCAVFESDRITIAFYTGIGGSYPVRDAHLRERDGNTVYYPHQNEAIAEVNVGDIDEELDTFAEDVCLRYATVDGETFICSDYEVTAYGGTFMVVNEDIYEVKDNLLFTPEDRSEPDEFLGIESVEEPVAVRNVSTGYTLPVTYSRVSELIENDEPNGALQLREPDNVLAAATSEL